MKDTLLGKGVLFFLKLFAVLFYLIDINRLRMHEKQNQIVRFEDKGECKGDESGKESAVW